MTTASPILLTLGQTLGPAPRGRTAAPVPLRWPNKLPNSTRLYGLDASLLLLGAALKTVALSIDPVEVNGLAATTPTITGATTSAAFSGGVPNRDYGVTWVLVFSDGTILEVNAGLYVPPYAYPANGPW